MKKTIGLLLICLAIPAMDVRAERPVMTGQPSGNILATGSRRVMIMDPKGVVLWQHRGDNVSDCWMRKNGNVL